MARHGIAVRTMAAALLGAAVLASCGGAGSAEQKDGSKELTIWTKFNDGTPQNDTDRWLQAFLLSLKVDEGLTAKNVFVPYDQINSKVNLAVQAGGDVPDLSYVDSQYLGFYTRNEALMDLTDFVKSAPWYRDLNPVALASCTGADGKIYMVPAIATARLHYYWTAAFPQGVPRTTEELLAEGRRLKGAGKFAVTFKGSETGAVDLFYFSLIHSFGGRYGDERGRAAWATPETARAVEFIRTLFAEGYVPDVALSAGFDFETPFKDGSAGLFAAGSWSYVFLNPLTSFDGRRFDSKSASVEEALTAGALGIAPPLAAPGGKPVSNVSTSGFAIPAGAKNAEAAKAAINYLMDSKRTADFAVAFGALPTLGASLRDPRFAESAYWRQIQQVVDEYGRSVEPLADYDRAMQKLSDTIVTLIQNPRADIMAALQRAQDEVNAGL